jgi:hypothetical protein
VAALPRAPQSEAPSVPGDDSVSIGRRNINCINKNGLFGRDTMLVVRIIADDKYGISPDDDP